MTRLTTITPVAEKVLELLKEDQKLEPDNIAFLVYKEGGFSITEESAKYIKEKLLKEHPYFVGDE